MARRFFSDDATYDGTSTAGSGQVATTPSVMVAVAVTVIEVPRRFDGVVESGDTCTVWSPQQFSLVIAQLPV